MWSRAGRHRYRNQHQRRHSGLFLKFKSSNTWISCNYIMKVDILVSSKDQEEHKLNLRVVFKQLQKKKKGSTKSSVIMARRSLYFLGMFFSGYGISPYPNKVEGVVILKYQPLLLKYNVCWEWWITNERLSQIMRRRQGAWENSLIKSCLGTSLLW